MTTSVYPSYQAVGRPIQFQGLQGVYILFTAIALVADFLLFVILYCCGLFPIVCVLIAFSLGVTTIAITRRLSHRFGANGLRKYLAARRLPEAIRFDSRQALLNLINKRL
jgi:hypothetical protein